jgi:hypothetical protein
MDLIHVLQYKGILVNKGEDLRKKWEDQFANSISSQEKKLIYF